MVCFIGIGPNVLEFFLDRRVALIDEDPLMERSLDAIRAFSLSIFDCFFLRLIPALPIFFERGAAPITELRSVRV